MGRRLMAAGSFAVLSWHGYTQSASNIEPFVSHRIISGIIDVL